jgi:hypothetical protein
MPSPNYALYQITRKVRDQFLNNLRRNFSTDPKYTYVELPSGEFDYNNTKIIIADMVPQDHLFYPAIIVESLGGDEQRYIGPDALGYEKNNSNVVTNDQIFTSISSSIAINIYTINDSIARDEITDTVYQLYKYTNTDLANYGIEIVMTHFPVHNQTYADNRWYQTGRITIDLYSEWDGDYGVQTTVSGLNISLSLSE